MSRELLEALREISEMKPELFEFPEDWHDQIEACKECQRYKDHPIQQGICDDHRRPLWDRKDHERSERLALGARMREVASRALSEYEKQLANEP